MIIIQNVVHDDVYSKVYSIDEAREYLISFFKESDIEISQNEIESIYKMNITELNNEFEKWNYTLIQ